jgi:hypothetical protein
MRATLGRWARAASGSAVLMLALGWPCASPAAERRRTALEYGFGFGAIQVRDDLLRPLRWTGGAGGVALGLDVERAKWWYRVDAELGVGILWNRYGHQGALFTHGLRTALTHRVRRTRAVELWAGAAYRYESLDAYFFDWDDSFLYWLTTHSLAPAVTVATRRLPKTELWATVDMPLVGLLSRPSPDHWYKVDPLPYFERWPALVNERLRWFGPGDAFAPTVSVRADRSLGPRLGVRAGLELTYRRAREPRGYSALGQKLLLELRHAF